jgi:hypothetical protein
VDRLVYAFHVNNVANGLFGMMEGRRLFEFAIYRLSPEAYERQLRAATEKLVAQYGLDDPSGRPFGMVNYILQREFPLFAYNEIMGWVRLVVTGMSRSGSYATIKGYYSRRDSRRIVRNSHAKFVGSTKFAEFGVFREDAPEEIVDRIRATVNSITAGRGIFSGRYIDFEAFDSIAAQVDWHVLLDIAK